MKRIISITLTLAMLLGTGGSYISSFSGSKCTQDIFEACQLEFENPNEFEARHNITYHEVSGRNKGEFGRWWEFSAENGGTFITHPPVVSKISAAEELAEAFPNWECFNCVECIHSKYDVSFFDDKFLAFVYWGTYPYWTSFLRITSVSSKGEQIDVEVTSIGYQVFGGTNAVDTDWVIFIEMDRALIGKDVAVTTSFYDPPNSYTPHPAPTVSGAPTANSITLAAITGAEYRIATPAVGNWQASPKFTGLTPDTEYTFQARLAIPRGTGIPAAVTSPESAVIRTSAPLDVVSWQMEYENPNEFEERHNISYYQVSGGFEFIEHLPPFIWHPPIVSKISSAQELAEVFPDWECLSCFECMSKYDDSFFDDKFLVFVHWATHPDPNNFLRITSVCDKEGTLDIEVTHVDLPVSVLPAVVVINWVIFLEMDKAQADKNIAVTTAFYDSPYPFDPHPAPTVSGIPTANSITLAAITGAEYRIATPAVGNWQASPVFTGLTPDTEYTFQARLAIPQWTNISAAIIRPESAGSAVIRTAPSPLYGDVNSDGVINSADVTMLKYYIASSDRPKFRADNPTFNFENARVAGGTDVTAADVSLLQLWIATPVNERGSVVLGPG
jgi:chitodextrinase